jgi:putative membrane protein
MAPAGQQLFALHQVQHLLIRLLGPLLIVLSYPLPVLRAGMPRNLRRRIWNITQRPTIARVIWNVTSVPAAFIILVGWFYFWQTPFAHNAALGAPALALFAHAGMTLSGLLFFGVMMDRRDAPEGAVHSLRLMALLGVILSNILLGSLTTMKEIVLYVGYDIPRQILERAALADETVGGFLIWIPSSILIIASIILVFNGWNAAETQRWNARNDHPSGSNSAALAYPETAEELWIKVADANRRMRTTLFIVPPTIFAIVMTTFIVIVYFL